MRLKGGDPFLFGRGGEELELLRQHGIPFEIVPGVSSAIAAPAYAGIPVTHRQTSSSLHIVTGHRQADPSPGLDFPTLATLCRQGTTIVFLMGMASLPEICRGLLAAAYRKTCPQRSSKTVRQPGKKRWFPLYPACRITPGNRDFLPRRYGGLGMSVRMGNGFPLPLGGSLTAAQDADMDHPPQKPGLRPLRSLGTPGGTGTGIALESKPKRFFPILCWKRLSILCRYPLGLPGPAPRGRPLF